MMHPFRSILLSACALLTLLSPALYALDPPTPPTPISIFRYELLGDSEEALVKEGATRALRSAIGQIYFSDYMLFARNLLVAYVDKDWNRLVARHKVLKSEIRGGRRFVSIEVVIDNKTLYQDLAEKKFLYRPAFRPVFYIFLSETIDGKAGDPIARNAILEMIDKRQLRYLWTGEDEFSSLPTSEKRETVLPFGLPNKNAMASETDLGAACREAERNGVEVFVAGAIASVSNPRQTVYFDDYTFVETSCTLYVVRADTGEVLATSAVKVSSGHTNPQMALKNATLDAVNKTVPAILDSFTAQWDKTIQRKADMRIMATGVDTERLGLLRQILASASANAEVYTRSFFEDVAVLTLTGEGDTSKLLTILRETDYPSFTVTLVEPGSIVIDSLVKPGELIIEVPGQ